MIDTTIKKKLRFNDPLTFTESHILYDCAEKLEQIQRIVNEWENEDVEDQDTIGAFHSIKKVLEQE